MTVRINPGLEDLPAGIYMGIDFCKCRNCTSLVNMDVKYCIHFKVCSPDMGRTFCIQEENKEKSGFGFGCQC